MTIDISALPVIEDGSITATQLADGAVTTPKLADAAVATAKLADTAVSSAKLADAAVSSAKIADAAVATDKLADSAVSSVKLADTAVSSAKLADSAVTTAKIADLAVGVSKTSQQVRQVPLQRNTNEVSIVGTTETEVKTLSFAKKNASPWISLAVNAGIKVSNAAAVGSLKVYINSEVSPRATLTTQSTSYDTQETAAIDISDLANGDHTVHFKLVSDTVAVTVWNKLLELFAEKDVA